MDKLSAHQKGALHRAFSVFIFNYQGKLLIQKRASCKYHSPNEWANTCCGHPRENETIISAAQRRLKEETGLSCAITQGVSFIYKADLADGLIEHEYVYFFKGHCDYTPTANPFEISEFLWISESELFSNTHNLKIAPWFAFYLEQKEEIIRLLFKDF